MNGDLRPPDDAVDAVSGADRTDPIATSSATSRSKRARLRAYRTRRRTKKALRSKVRRRLTRAAITVSCVLLLIVGGSVGYAMYRFGQITYIPSGPAVHPAPPGEPENILLIGSTDRCAATKLKVFAKECAESPSGINSDVVMIVRLVPKDHRVTLLSIPRDTFIPDARSGKPTGGYGGIDGLYNRIDAALLDGPAQLAAAIMQDFGIPINHFVELNFATFTNVVNVLGGIYMYFPDRVYDASSPPLEITRRGCNYLNGYRSLALVRSRHLYYFTKGEKINFKAIQKATKDLVYYTPNSGGSYDGTGDLGRITRVHEFLKVFASAVAKRGLGNIFTDNALIGAIAPDLALDNTFGKSEIVHLALEFHSANLGTAPELTAPIVVDAATYSYKGYSYGDVVFPSEPQDQQTIDQFMGNTPTGLKLSPKGISVSVIDGTGSTSATETTAARLRALGYPVVPTNASNYVGPVSETTVLYAKGHLDDAERVMASLTGTVVMAEGVPASDADVSVVAGSDLSVAAPSGASAGAPSTASTTSPATSTTAGHTTTRPTQTTTSIAPTSTPPTTNPNLGTPTSAIPGLAPWDPRACPTPSPK